MGLGLRVRPESFINSLNDFLGLADMVPVD